MTLPRYSTVIATGIIRCFDDFLVTVEFPINNEKLNDMPTSDLAYYTCTLSKVQSSVGFLERVGQNKLIHGVPKYNDTEPNIPNKKNIQQC